MGDVEISTKINKRPLPVGASDGVAQTKGHLPHKKLKDNILHFLKLLFCGKWNAQIMNHSMNSQNDTFCACRKSGQMQNAAP
jgi:hypothetical protein